MIAEGALMGFVPTTDAVRARAFYEGVLGLTFVSDDPFALVLVSAGGIFVRLAKMESFEPVAYTILGWRVKDAEGEAQALAAKGVVLKRYPGMEQSAAGVWTAPGGTKIAWFLDPDGNLLSVSEHPEDV